MVLNKSNEKFRQHAKARDRLIEGFHRVMKPKSVYNLDNHRLIEDNIISTVKLMKLIKYQKLKTPEKPNYFLKKTDYLIHRKYERKKALKKKISNLKRSKKLDYAR